MRYRFSEVTWKMIDAIASFNAFEFHPERFKLVKEKIDEWRYDMHKQLGSDETFHSDQLMRRYRNEQDYVEDVIIRGSWSMGFALQRRARPATITEQNNEAEATIATIGDTTIKATVHLVSKDDVLEPCFHYQQLVTTCKAYQSGEVMKDVNKMLRAVRYAMIRFTHDEMQGHIETNSESIR